MGVSLKGVNIFLVFGDTFLVGVGDAFFTVLGFLLGAGDAFLVLIFLGGDNFFSVIAIYKTTHLAPVSTVTVTPLLMVIGPAVIAFFVDTIV